MFIGHYGPAVAIGGGRVKLWHAILAVQWLDLLWAPFILLGIEKVRVVENFAGASHLDLYHMPWTHSLPMALVWSVLGGVLYRVIWHRAGIAGGLLIGGLIFSHWILDFLTHKPDLELWFGGVKVGLGLWENKPLAFGLELGLFGVGSFLFLQRVKPVKLVGCFALALFVIVGIALQIYGNFGPVPVHPSEVAISAFVAFSLFAGLAWFVDATTQR